MKKEKFVLATIIVVFLLVVIGSTFYPEPWSSDQDADGHDISNAGIIRADSFEGTSITVSQILAATSWCYQESANTSTPCGGLSTGVYFNSTANWYAVRLGSPSNNLPDVMCINNWHRTIIAIEAKSVISDFAYVPADQIERCNNWVEQFGVYHKRITVLAFKFGQTKNRPLKIYYKIFPESVAPSQVRCRQGGKTSIKINDKWTSIVMEDLTV